MGIKSRIASWLISDPQVRATLRNPVADWLRDALDADPTVSGESVTYDSALSVSTVYACVRVISETIGTLPLFVYRRVNAKTKERSRSHPLYTLLHDAPNPETTASVFEETLTSHVLSWGNGYARIERNGAGLPRALWNLRPDRIKPERVGASNQLVYTRSDGTGRVVEQLLPENVLHVPALGFDGLVGFSPISKAREAIGLALASQTAAGSLFANGSFPGGVLEAPQVIDEQTQARLRKSWEALHKGAGKRSKVGILEQGMTYKPISFTPEDSQFLESRQFSVAEICRWFRVPPHKVQDLSRSTFSNIEHQSIEFLTDTIRPWLVKLEQEFRRKLFGPDDDEFFAEHMVDALLRGDSHTRHKVYATGRQWGYYSTNDVRGFENLNPVDGGDVYLSPMNMKPADQMGEESKPPPAPEPDEEQEQNPPVPPADAASVREIALPVLRDAFERIQRVEVDKLRRAWRRPNTEFGAWRSKFYGNHCDHVQATLLPALASVAMMTQNVTNGDELTMTVACDYCDRSQRDIDAAFSSGGDAGIAFDQCLDRWQADRATDEATMVLDTIITE